jgi:hypothetical protein
MIVILAYNRLAKLKSHKSSNFKHKPIKPFAMKPYFPILALVVAAFSSCTSAYKTGQTPDDVYFSPEREKEEYVRVEKRDDRYYRGSDDYYEDRFLRMRLQDRYRWSALDDYYFYNTFAYSPYGNYYRWNSPWNAHWAWNSFYNPYCVLPYYHGAGFIKNPAMYNPPSRAVAFNPASYIRTGNTISATGSRPAGTNSYNANRYNNTNRSSNSGSLGQSLRKVFSNENSGSNHNNSGSTPSRTYNPSSSSSSSSSGSRSSGGGSSGGGVSRPPR